MLKLENIQPNVLLDGLRANETVTVVQVEWLGSDTLDVTYRDSRGMLHSETLMREHEASLDVQSITRPFDFGANGLRFKLAAEAYRIHNAYLFDPMIAVHTSLVDPLPHQISAVYEHMLPKQPLRFLLADDPGAGKTIMTGLFIKELVIRGDVERCLICVPGGLADQWQDELTDKFGLHFEILTREMIEASHSGNPFAEHDRIIIRLDQVARSEELQAKLQITDWDLVIVDEAHKMSATVFGGEVKETKRYKLGRLLGRLTRHLLLLTATPHNGKEEDFQLFLALLDQDRFEGRFRDGPRAVDTDDIMRRLVKEKLVRFDGTPLFPERIAETPTYDLSPEEKRLYDHVTAYVREEFNRAERLNEGRRGQVGFALTTLQRRLASSPEAIYKSLENRRKRLEKRLMEARQEQRMASDDPFSDVLRGLRVEDFEDIDDYTAEEYEEREQEITDLASAAQTVRELEAEVAILKRLVEEADEVRRSGRDKKWEQLSKLLQDETLMRHSDGRRRKLVIFTEHRDTLQYLATRIRNLFGDEKSVVTIQGGMGRDERRKVQALFTQDKDVHVLVATDAAGEGINLQVANLMVNYDLPWNPNRLEQRFGRIHRIGQTEVCRLWNLVAKDSQESLVFQRLFEKLDEERRALGGQVFDVLGRVFENRMLRDLLVEAIRYGDRPEVRTRLSRQIDHQFRPAHLREILSDRGLAIGDLSSSHVQEIRDMMLRAEAKRLQPHYIQSFFLAAFEMLGGRVVEREPGRYEISHVPAKIRRRDRVVGQGRPVLERYQRICFEKKRVRADGKPMAEFVCPGHPLLEAVVDLMLEENTGALKQGSVLVDPNDTSFEPRILFLLSHEITDERELPNGRNCTVSRQVQFVEIDRNGTVRSAGYAPHLDYDFIDTDDNLVSDRARSEPWLADVHERTILPFAVEHLVPQHLREVRARVEVEVDKTLREVEQRLRTEIRYWDRRAVELRDKEQAQSDTFSLNSKRAKERADSLARRLDARRAELGRQRQLHAGRPLVIGGALVLPKSYVERLLAGDSSSSPQRSVDAEARRRVELLAMDAVMERERALGNTPKDVSALHVGYDIESRTPDDNLRFIEVKGRVADARTVTLTRNEILTGLNTPDEFILALALIGDSSVQELHYLKRSFTQDIDFAVTSIDFEIKRLIQRAGEIA